MSKYALHKLFVSGSWIINLYLFRVVQGALHILGIGMGVCQYACTNKLTIFPSINQSI